MRRCILFPVLLLAAVCALSAQKKESLALFPFTGGNASDGTAIVSSLARQRTLRDAFSKVTLVTQNTIATMNFEQRFQRNSGLTDADTIFELGKALNAQYVIAGYITKLGDRNLVLVSIMDVESLQQIAGDYRAYKTIEEIDALIPDIAKKLAAAVPRNTSSLPGLSVPPFVISKDVNQNDAMVLAQILSCDLANSGKYAVLPRTDSIEKVMEEHQRQRSGATDQERIKKLGAGRNAQFVLSGSVQKLGTLNKFTADILNILDGSFIDGHEESYTNFSQGFELVPKLAVALAGTTTISTPANFVRVEGGTFQMGSPANEPERGNNEMQRQVTVSSFNMGKYPVTQKEWQEVMGTTVWQQRDIVDKTLSMYGEGDNYPMYYISWYEAIEYCNRRSQKEGLTPAYTIDKSRSDPNNQNSYDNVRWAVTWNRNANGYRLPTEAEWEYACRAGTRTPFNTGNNITTNLANYNGNNPYNNNAKGTYRQKTTAVGSFPANPWGLHDMHGNVGEWCWDWYGNYPNGAQTDPLGASSGSLRVVRGGGLVSSAAGVRSARRFDINPSARAHFVGFRLVRP